MKHQFDQSSSDFFCKHCHNYVSTDPMLSGVNNRNHCPYCMWSRHMDWREAGDRLSACKAGMRPVGLTLKQTHKKYGSGQGELMIIHVCEECGKVSINRTAADDDAETLMAIFESSGQLDPATRLILETSGVQALSADQAEVVRARLYGWEAADLSR